jgi:hypothetical protein
MKLDISTRKTTKTPARRKKSVTASVAAARRTRVVPVKTAGNRAARLTTIKAKIDVGFGNALYLRGQGDGLSWERGVPLKCVDGQTWQWSGPVAKPLTFKLLVNDTVWARGEDIVAKPGQKLEIAPTF